jgi:hypothetical protein
MMEAVGNARTCAVSYVDSDGIRHSVEVTAESLYEAAALGIQEFRRHPWSDDVAPGKMTPLEVAIKSAVTTHEVRVRQVEQWLASSAKSPRDTMLKARVRAILDGKP